MADIRRLPSLNALKAFAMAAQHGSFTQAGLALHVTQGAISRQVKQLESALGVALFVRNHQKVELTAVGQDLAKALTRLFDEMEVVVQAAAHKATSGTSRQTLRLNVPPTFATRWLAPRLPDFQQRYANIDLLVTTDRIHSLRAARSVDCLVHFGTTAWAEVDCEPLMLERHVLASSPSLWLAGQPKPLPESTLLHVLDGATRIPVWEAWIELYGPQALDPRPGLTFSTLDQAINAAIAGSGVVVVDQAMIVRELQNGTLRRHGDQYMDGPNGYFFVQLPVEPAAQDKVENFKRWLLAQATKA